MTLDKTSVLYCISDLVNQHCGSERSLLCIFTSFLRDCYIMVALLYAIITLLLPCYYSLLHCYYAVITHFYTVITHYYTVITHYYIVITLLLLIITHYKCNNEFIITVIMGSLLPIFTRSIIGNNGFIITYYEPDQLADGVGHGAFVRRCLEGDGPVWIHLQLPIQN